jgi:hypothetical protein
MVWTTSEGDLRHPKCTDSKTNTLFLRIGPSETEEETKKENENITIICDNQEVKNFEALDWHVVTDSDLMCGGEV